MDRKKLLAIVAVIVLVAVVVKVVGATRRGGPVSPSDGDLQVINT